MIIDIRDNRGRFIKGNCGFQLKHSVKAKKLISESQLGRKSTKKQLEILKRGREKHTKLIKTKGYWTEERRENASKVRKTFFANGEKRPVGFTRKRTEKEKVKMRGRIPWNYKGKPKCLDCGKIISSHSVKRCKSCVKKGNNYGTLGAKMRWANHIKVEENKFRYKYQYQSYKEKYPNGATERKRFTNQRYKARKKDALGSHTFEEWLMLKVRYNYMCLCCKRFEPEIKLTEDHIIPISCRGTDYIDNIQPLCQSCNTKKFTKIIDYKKDWEGGEQVFIN